MSFQKEFIFGVSTAAFQIEGATAENGRTPSIWDTFCQEDGRIFENDNGDTACDHYHRYKEDIAIIKDLGVDSYRFSISWPRIFPKKDYYNEKGMQFYKNVLTELKKQGISAAITLYHWDLPQWVQDLGGFETREAIDLFLQFAEKCFSELNEFADMWITFNEPWCSSFLSNALGQHAPGKIDLEAGIKVAHNILLAHGRTVALYHRLGYTKKIGITLNLSPAYAYTNSFSDKLAENIADGFINRWFLEPLFKGQYPQDMAMLFTAICRTDYSFIEEGDLTEISEPCDFLGINYYTRQLVSFDADNQLFKSSPPSNYKQTSMGWDICPNEFIDLIKCIRRNYTNLPIYITENGSVCEDILINDTVKDDKRIDYLLLHLDAVDKMNDLGLNVAGYFCWSLLDNFEWSFGYSKRFGIVYVDYQTLKRTKKDSFYAYKKYIIEHKK